MTRIKIIGAAVLALLALIIVLQNTEEVTTRFLFVKVEMPRAVLLFISMFIGIAIGLLIAFIFAGRKKK